jgi:hypothetical protein
MKYTLTGLIVLLCAMTQAQTWHYGIKADLNLSNIVGTGMKSTFVAGGELGGFTSVSWNKKWALQAEVLASQEMTKRGYDFNTYYNQNGNAYSGENIKLVYLNVPILFRYNVVPQLSLVAGPQIGFLLNDDEDLLKYNQRAFKTYALSGNLGAEFNIQNVALYARYNLGINNINDVDNRYRWAAQHIQLGIAIKFR